MNFNVSHDDADALQLQAAQALMMSDDAQLTIGHHHIRKRMNNELQLL